MERSSARTSERRRRNAALPIVVLVVGCVASALAWTALARADERAAQSAFRAEARERLQRIEARLADTEAALEDLASLYSVTGEATPEQFATFVGPILARRPAFRALSWNPVVRGDERAAHEAAARQAGLAGYRILERDARGELVPAGARDFYVVVGSIEPREANARAVGFDVYSEETRRQAIDAALDSGGFSVAVGIELVQADRVSQGALGFLPRFAPDAPTATVEQRRENVVGFFVSVVEVDVLIDAALDELDPAGIEVVILDDVAFGDPDVIYRSGGSDAALSRGIEWVAETSWGGNDLIVQFAPRAGTAGGLGNPEPLAALVGGLLLTLLVAGYLQTFGARAARIERKVAERTGELEQTNAELEEEIARRTAAEASLRRIRGDLEREVDDRTAELQYATSQLQAIVDSEPECVKVMTGDGDLVEMNPAGLRMIEADDLDQVRGLNVYSLISPHDRPAFVELNRRVVAGEGGTLEFELRGLRGAVRRLETHAVPLVLRDGEPPLHLAITRDVTADRIAEEERARLEAQLRHSQKLESVGVLARGIAHDFNNFLHIIIGNTEIALSERQRGVLRTEALQATRSAAMEAAKLCDQMLTYAGESRPDVRPLSLPRIVRSMVEILDAGHTKKVLLSIDVDDHVGEIKGDPVQLGQVVMNLVTNAAEAIGTESGTVQVRVRALEGAVAGGGRWFDTAPAAGRYVGLEVTDDGSGMSSDELELIFDPFYTTKFAGRGLGLSSTLGIVRAHSGHLGVSTEVGAGSTFTVLFPATSPFATLPPDRPPTKDVADDVAVDVANEVAPAERLTGAILVVDDERPILDVVGEILESIGLRVFSASDGGQALDTFDAHSAEIDVVMLDITMPNLDGNETCAALRARRPDLPVIFCSGYAADVATASMTGDAFTGFLHKPYRKADLVDTLLAAERASGWATRRPSQAGEAG